MKKCQICEGPIVNGRCKFCGMIYRNDEEMYHLNEDRSEHYKHASRSVRQKMREQEIPLADRQRTAVHMENPQAEQSLKDLTAEQIRARRQSAQRRAEQTRAAQQKRLAPKPETALAAQNKTGRKKETQPGGEGDYTITHDGKVKIKKKRFPLMLLIWILFILFGSFSSCMDYVEKRSSDSSIDRQDSSWADIENAIDQLFGQDQENQGVHIYQNK